MSIVFSADLGVSLGWSIGDSAKGNNGTVLEADTIDLAKEATILRCSREGALYEWALKTFKERKIEVYCREASIEALRQQLNQRGYKSDRNLGLTLEQHSYYAAALRIAAERRGVRILDPVDPRSLKKFGTDSGKAKKPQMMHAAKLLYGIDITDNNAADAAHVCAWAMLRIRNEARKFQGVDW